ncbi:hypothetical protein ACIBAG_36300 [Streptomyces sp. NPDC051243]
MSEYRVIVCLPCGAGGGTAVLAGGDALAGWDPGTERALLARRGTWGP